MYSNFLCDIVKGIPEKQVSPFKIKYSGGLVKWLFLIDGKKISSQIKDELKTEIAEMKKKGTEVTLAVIQVGNDPASSVYVGNKKKACAYIGIRSLAYELPESTTEMELLTFDR